MMKKNILAFTVLLSLTGLLLNCEGFLEGPMLTEDPNRTTEVPLLEQLVGAEVMTYGFYEGDIGIFSVLFMQQIAGVIHQYAGYEAYLITADEFGGAWQQIYNEGGMVDMNQIIEEAEDAGRRTLAGVAKMYKALMVSGAADVWGDIPYSQAAQPDDYPTPVYDDQEDVHNAVLDLLDDAIADFTAAEAADEYFDGSYDFSFDGDRNAWIEAAHTLKARILLNWAEVYPGNYALALTEAQSGISSTDGNWQAKHNDVLGEQLVFFQWDAQRDYINCGKQGVEMFRADNDPRLEFYFETVTIMVDTVEVDTIWGSGHNEQNEDASWLNRSTLGAADWDFDMVSWEENQYIIAECQYQAGNEAGALATVNETLLGIEDRWSSYFAGDTIPLYSGLTGTDLLQRIIHEKYKALFFNYQVWSDWKRTGYPVLTLGAGFTEAPRRFLYPEDEINTNPNTPLGLDLFDHNDNDPN